MWVAVAILDSTKHNYFYCCYPRPRSSQHPHPRQKSLNHSHWHRTADFGSSIKERWPGECLTFGDLLSCLPSANCASPTSQNKGLPVVHPKPHPGAMLEDRETFKSPNKCQFKIVVSILKKSMSLDNKFFCKLKDFQQNFFPTEFKEDLIQLSPGCLLYDSEWHCWNSFHLLIYGNEVS